MAKTINAVFTSGVFTRTAKVFQWDNGDKLAFVNVDLPNNYQVHFANSLTGESKSVLGDSTGVEIPPEYFVPGSEIYAWVWVSTENGGFTKYQVTIPVYRRAQPQNVTPTPAQQTIIDQAIEALNQALETQITPEEKAKLAGIEAGAQVNDIEHIYATDPSTGEVVELPIGFLYPAKSVLIPDYLEIKTLDFTVDSNGDVTSGPLWNDIYSAFDTGRKVLLAKVTDSGGNIHTLPLTKFYEAPNGPPSYTFAGCGDDGKIRLIQEGSYANAWVYTEFDFDSDIGYLSAEIGYPGNLTTTAKDNLVAAINEVNAKEVEITLASAEEIAAIVNEG